MNYEIFLSGDMNVTGRDDKITITAITELTSIISKPLYPASKTEPMSTKKLFWIIFFALLMTITAISQNVPRQNIRGRVTDKLTKVPLPGATVILLDVTPFIGTATDENGFFRLEAVPIGRVSIKVSYVGYKEVVLSNLQLTTGKELFLEIELEERVVEQQEVVIMAPADKTAPINPMATVSARSFTIEETSRYAGTRNDVARMASNYAGVVGVNDARNDIIIRGNSPMGLLWQLEGIPIPNPNHYGSFTSTGGPVSMLNNNVLMNSDFLTGAFPASYGNALSGVFDLRMRSGNNEKHEFLGQIGFNGFELGAEGPINRKLGASYLAYGRYSTLAVMDKIADLGTGTGIPYYQDITAKINLPHPRWGNFSLFLLGGSSDIQVWDSRRDTTKNKIDFYGGEGFDLTNSADMITGGINHLKIWTPRTYTRIIIAGSYHRFETLIDSLVPDTFNKSTIYQNDFKQNTISARFVLNHRVNSRNSINAGIMGRNLAFDLDEDVFFNQDQALRKISAYQGSSMLYETYTEWKHRFTDHLSLNTGIHAMWYAFNHTGSVEPRAGLKWQTSEKQSFGLGYGLHSMVNPISVYFRQTRLSDGSFVMLNKDLPFPRSHHFVLSWDRSFNPFTRIKTELYYQHIFKAGVDGGSKNSFSMLNQGANFGFPTPDTIVAEGIGRNYGMELTFERFLHKGLYYLFTASLFDSKYQGSDGVWRNTAFNNRYIFNLLLGKEWQFGARKEKQVRKQYAIFADVKATYAGGQCYTPSVAKPDPLKPGYYVLEYIDSEAFSLRFDDYSRVDFKVGYKTNGRKVTQEFLIDVQNLFNRKNVFMEKFNKKTGEKSYTYQTGLLIIPQYRITF